MKTRATWLAILGILTMAVPTLAGSAHPPVIPLAMIEPHVAIPGEILTFGAYVVVPEVKTDELPWVGLFFDQGTGMDDWIFVRELVLDEILGIYRCRITLPEDVPMGHYNFAIVAANDAGHGNPYPLHLIVVPPEAPIPELYAPEYGQVFGAEPPLLAWSLVEGATHYEVELSYEWERFEFTVPGFFTALPFNELVWWHMPDGRYLWRVRAVRGDRPGPWSELGFFFKDLADPESDGADGMLP